MRKSALFCSCAQAVAVQKGTNLHCCFTACTFLRPCRNPQENTEAKKHQRVTLYELLSLQEPAKRCISKTQMSYHYHDS